MTRISAVDGIHRRYLHDEVAERIRELVLSGELEPNSRVNELELAERFGISRTPSARRSRFSRQRACWSSCPIVARGSRR